ncbi:MAG: hypothetical protein H0X33_07315 [Taibaiella sp.]|nr:hypothetical protein [Taibaiella sp.]
MKKLIFAALCLIGAMGVKAQSCSVVNNTGCNLQFCLSGAAPGVCSASYSTCGPTVSSISPFSTLTFTPAYFSISAINWVHFDFLNPNAAGCTATPPAVFVGDPCGGDPSTNSVTLSCAPCAGTTINVSWSKDPFGNVTITLN